MTKLTNNEKKLLSQVKDMYAERILYYICTGDVANLTPLACENLLRRWIDLEKNQKGEENNGRIIT